MRLVLFQPDIPPNVGTLLRLGACLDVPVDVIEPCGFPFSHKQLKRAGMDYAERVRLTRHDGWAAFAAWWQTSGRRLVLLTVKGAQPHTEVAYRPDDLLLLGRETAGVPDEVHAAADVRIAVPMAPGMRSLNVAMAGAMVLGEALRQCAAFPGGPPHEPADF